MTTASRISDVAAVDAFLAAAKTLDGPPPTWGDSAWGGEYVASWIVLDELDAPVAQLRFTARKTDPAVASISVIFRGHAVWRVDMENAGVCHSNPHDGHLLGLDALVCGPHEHAWPINRDFLLRQDLWRLPYRQALPPQIRRVEQALFWLASQINLTIGGDQRGFDGPTKADLFSLGGTR